MPVTVGFIVGLSSLLMWAGMLALTQWLEGRVDGTDRLGRPWAVPPSGPRPSAPRVRQSNLAA